MQTLQEIDKEITYKAPGTIEDLKIVLSVLGVTKYKIKQVFYKGYLQGVHVIIEGKKLPLQRGNVYSVFS